MEKRRSTFALNSTKQHPELAASCSTLPAPNCFTTLHDGGASFEFVSVVFPTLDARSRYAWLRSPSSAAALSAGYRPAFTRSHSRGVTIDWFGSLLSVLHVFVSVKVGKRASGLSSFLHSMASGLLSPSPPGNLAWMVHRVGAGAACIWPPIDRRNWSTGKRNKRWHLVWVRSLFDWKETVGIQGTSVPFIIAILRHRRA